MASLTFLCSYYAECTGLNQGQHFHMNKTFLGTPSHDSSKHLQDTVPGGWIGGDIVLSWDRAGEESLAPYAEALAEIC